MSRIILLIGLVSLTLSLLRAEAAGEAQMLVDNTEGLGPGDKVVEVIEPSGQRFKRQWGGYGGGYPYGGYGGGEKTIIIKKIIIRPGGGGYGGSYGSGYGNYGGYSNYGYGSGYGNYGGYYGK